MCSKLVLNIIHNTVARKMYYMKLFLLVYRSL